MSEIQFDVKVAKGVAIDFANDILPVWWMEVYPFRVNQSESLLHAEIKLYKNSLRDSVSKPEVIGTFDMLVSLLYKVI